MFGGIQSNERLQYAHSESCGQTRKIQGKWSKDLTAPDAGGRENNGSSFASSNEKRGAHRGAVAPWRAVLGATWTDFRSRHTDAARSTRSLIRNCPMSPESHGNPPS